MVRWREYLAGVGMLALGVTMAAAQIPDNGLPQVQIIINPLPAMAVPANDSPDLPIVNTGFANDQDVTGPIKPLVQALRSPVFGERETAHEALLRLPPGRLPEVVEALGRETDAEAIERLTQAAAHLFLKPRTLLKTKASLLGVWFRQPSLTMLGIKFKMDAVNLTPRDASPTMTVMVTELQVGFPAMQSLRNGDRIVAMGGVGFPPDVPADNTDYFRARVAALWPGAVVQMTILREGKLLDAGVQVAGLPVNGAVSAESMVEMRTAALNAFLRTLNTGDKTQAQLMAPSEPR